MIRLIELQNRSADIEVSISPTVRTYNIVSDLMADDCKPYRVAEHVMIWLDPAGFLGEVEAIYPPMTTSALCQYGDTLQKRNGFPQLAIMSCDNEGIIQPLDNGFTLWLAKEKIIDLEVTFKNVQFLFAQEELVGLIAHQALIIE